MSSKKNKSTDDRFSKVTKDPRFWEMPEKERKVKIDKRFQSMFHDERFKVKYTVDKRGRPINHTSTEDLKRFYNLSSEEEEEEEEDVRSKKLMERKKNKNNNEKPDSLGGGDKVAVKVDKKQKKGKVAQGKGGNFDGEQSVQGFHVSKNDDGFDDKQQNPGKDDIGGYSKAYSEREEDEEDDEDDSGAEEESGLESSSDAESESDEEDSDSGPDFARGKGNVETSSDEEEEDEVEAILRREEEEIEHDWGELCKDALRNDEVSARLAICNMDWDRMKAKDLLALVNSFKPKGGVVLSVKIYPSEFGKERLKVEETQAPPELMALPEDPEHDTKEERIYREKMRDYQFKRLKYYYAVVECDSPETAVKIYEECDGFEYESSCSILDLRFIPSDVTFDDEPKDVATDVDLSAYTPKLFTSSASATSKVEVTWDETDHDRVMALNRKFNKDELMEMDFNAYLASSSEEEEDEDEEETITFREEEDAKASNDKQMEKGAAGGTKKQKEKKKNSAEQISKYRELLKNIQDKEKLQQEDRDMEMEISWVPGLRETTEELVKKKLQGNDKLTPWEEYLKKKKDKQKNKKKIQKQGSANSESSDEDLPLDVDLNDPFFAEELGSTGLKKNTKGKKGKRVEEEKTPEQQEELEKQKAEMALLMDDEHDGKKEHFNYDKIVEQQNLSKKKRKKLLKMDQALDEDDFQVDVKDPRFQAMFTSHLFNLDPSDPSYKNTQATKSIQAEKQRRRLEQQRHKEDAVGKLQATPTQDVQSRMQEVEANKQEMDPILTSTKKRMDPSLSMLIKSVKNKTEQFQARKKQKIA